MSLQCQESQIFQRQHSVQCLWHKQQLCPATAMLSLKQFLYVSLFITKRWNKWFKAVLCELVNHKIHLLCNFKKLNRTEITEWNNNYSFMKRLFHACKYIWHICVCMLHISICMSHVWHICKHLWICTYINVCMHMFTYTYPEYVSWISDKAYF